MAALCKNVLKKSSFYPILNNTHATPVWLSIKRHLRVDPEEEIQRLFIKDSQHDKLSQVKVTPARTVVVGAGFKDVKLDANAIMETVAQGDKPAHIFKKSTTRASRFKKSVLSRRLDGPSPINMPDVDDIYQLESYPAQASHVLNHYGILNDLFDIKDATVLFYPDPSLKLRIAFDLGDQEVLPVSLGNRIAPELSSSSPPLIGFEGKSGKYYTLLMVNLDGNLQKAEGEYLHWYCANMSADKGAVSGAECSYLQAIPLRGTGFHRYTFVMLEHDTEIPSSLLLEVTGSDLSSRDFSFSQFYSQLDQDSVRPVDIRFFQSEWDQSVRHAFHYMLDMPEPAFEYDYPPIKHPKQVKHAPKQPFQTYLDMYRDKKEVAEEVLKEHLSEISPFSSPEIQRLPYPLARPTKAGLYADQLPPTWQQKNLVDKANKAGKYKYIYAGDS